jgi:hypothetical protein
MSTLNRILVSDLVPSVQELHSSTFRSCSGPWRRSPRRRRPSSSTGAPLDRKREYTFLKLIETPSNSSSLVLARFCHAQIPKKKYFFQISLKKILCTVLNGKAEFCLLFILEFANDKTSVYINCQQIKSLSLVQVSNFIMLRNLQKSYFGHIPRREFFFFVKKHKKIFGNLRTFFEN